MGERGVIDTGIPSRATVMTLGPVTISSDVKPVEMAWLPVGGIQTVTMPGQVPVPAALYAVTVNLRA